MILEQGHKYTLRFTPRRTDDLKPPHPPIGEMIEVRCMYQFGAGDPFPGEWCLQPTYEGYPFWIPSGDMVLLTKRQRELLGEWFSKCEERTSESYLPSCWLEELEELVALILSETSPKRGEEASSP